MNSPRFFAATLVLISLTFATGCGEKKDEGHDENGSLDRFLTID